jgi:hypothetical protein
MTSDSVCESIDRCTIPEELNRSKSVQWLADSERENKRSAIRKAMAPLATTAFRLALEVNARDVRPFKNRAPFNQVTNSRSLK